MRLSVVLCLFLLISPVFQVKQKIVKIRGTMTVTDKFDSRDNYKEDEKTCPLSPYCIGFYCLSPGKCRLFMDDSQLQATLNEAKDGEESYYGIKVVLPNNECPNSYKDVDFKYSAPDGRITSWRKMSGVWKFESCKAEEWRRFERTSGKIVCIRGIKLTAGVLKEQAKSECAALGAVLTGVASIEESEWMQEQIDTITGKNDFVFWIAGERENTCTLGAAWAYKTNFLWGDGIIANTDPQKDAMTEANCDISCVSSEGEDERCWGIMNYKRGSDKKIADVPCGGSANMQGAFCAYELYK